MDVSPSAVTVVANPAFSDEFLSEPFFVEYDCEALDLTAMHPSIVTIPFLFNVLPVIWRAGHHYSLPAADAGVQASLSGVKDAFRRLYPEWAWEGSVTSEEAAENTAPPADGTAALYSGGVDSTYTVLRNTPEISTLVTVRGAGGLSLDDTSAWADAKCAASDYGRRHDWTNVFITSNFGRFLNLDRVNRLREGTGVTWWAAVQHGMGLVGLAAPAVFALGCRSLLIASTHTVGTNLPWGSHPSVDNQIRWAETQVRHDGYEIARSQKVQYVVNDRKRRQLPARPLLVCTTPQRRGNCGSCLKCLRTMAVLVVEEDDPRKYGFPASPEEAEHRIRERFRTVQLAMNDNEFQAWKGIQAHAVTHEAAPDSFTHWLATFDIDKYRARYRRRMRSPLRRLASRGRRAVARLTSG